MEFAADMETSQSAAQQQSKSEGRSKRSAAARDSSADTQAVARFANSFTRGATEENGSRTHRSIGLGLYLACQIARAHRGTLQLAASNEEGTTFAVQLPRDNNPWLDISNS